MSAFRHRNAGFTLLEIMVALAVLAIAMAAIVAESSQHIKNLTRLREHTIAHWIAMNRIAELQLQPTWPSTGQASGTVEMAKGTWRWESRVTDTEDDAVRRLDVTVQKDLNRKDDQLEHLIAYLGRPMATP
ncbi:MAG: type II secretion system protein GspI [Gammaproteobacteria bacterium]|nr:type II secretion system protein GspI [Gammaproteobacteria bacterium]